MLIVPPLPGTVPKEGEIASHWEPAVTCAVNESEAVKPELDINSKQCKVCAQKKRERELFRSS